MYEERFGLNSNPFRSNAEGGSVFAGPRQAKSMSALHLALKGADNILTVTGPAGVGKSVIVNRALETNKAHQLVSVIGRMRLGPDEVLDLLLAGFGQNPTAMRTLQKMAAFQRVLADRASKDIRVVIVVEDALRIGNDALLELEALTAADTGNGAGANLILLGLPEVEKRLNFPELARLRQRARMGQKIAAFDAAETQGYLKHTMRAAGANFDDVFETGAASMIYRCSEGVARVINNICDAALSAADEAGQDTVSAALIEEVAADVYGLEPIGEIPPIEPQPDDVENSDDELSETIVEESRENAAEPRPEPEPKPPAQEKPDLPPLVAAALAQEAEQGDGPRSDDSVELPDLSELADIDDISDDQLIADTGMHVAPEFAPDLDIPASQLAHTDEEDAGDDNFDDDDADLPTLSTSMRVEIPARNIAEDTRVKPPNADDSDLEVSEFTPDPTVRIEAIDPTAIMESELASEYDSEPEPGPEPEPEPEADPAAATGTYKPIPDLDALEAAISAARGSDPISPASGADDSAPVIADLSLAEPEPHAIRSSATGEIELSAQITLDRTLEDQRKEGQKLDKMAAELANASSLEDISDVMAETLFGEEFEAIAAEALANPPATGTFPDKEADVVASPATADSAPAEPPANDPITEPSPVMLDPVEATTDPRPSEVVLSSGQDQTSLPASNPAQPKVDSIDDQFQTGITRTLKSPKGGIPGSSSNGAGITEDEQKPGLLGRLKRSFKG